MAAWPGHHRAHGATAGGVRCRREARGPLGQLVPCARPVAHRSGTGRGQRLGRRGGRGGPRRPGLVHGGRPLGLPGTPLGPGVAAQPHGRLRGDVQLLCLAERPGAAWGGGCAAYHHGGRRLYKGDAVADRLAAAKTTGRSVGSALAGLLSGCLGQGSALRAHLWHPEAESRNPHIRYWSLRRCYVPTHLGWVLYVRTLLAHSTQVEAPGSWG